MKRIFTLIAITVSLVTMFSCDKFEDGRPSRTAIREFEKMYPDAWDVEWEYEGLYWEVSFETGKRPDGTEHSAWFDESGNWVMTKTEMAYSAVPQKVKDFLAASEYGTARLEDHWVDFYETPDGNFYRFDILVDGREREVDVTEDGKVSLAGLYY